MHQDIFLKKKKKKINTSLFSQLRHFAQLPDSWVSAADRYPCRGPRCQQGNGANKATWRLSTCCYAITVGRNGAARVFPAAWPSRWGWERLCSEVCSQGQEAGVAKGWGRPPTDSRPGPASPPRACSESAPVMPSVTVTAVPLPPVWLDGASRVRAGTCAPSPTAWPGGGCQHGQLSA